MFNFLKIPTPKALPIKEFLTPEEEEQGVLTWEDWEKENKEKYPIKWLLTRTIPAFLRRYVYGIYAPIPRLCYWIKCHTWKKYHLLDLRQGEYWSSPEDYRYGYLDAHDKILYACFNIFVEFMKNGGFPDPKAYFSSTEMLDPEQEVEANKMQEKFNESFEIFRYWRDQHYLSRCELNEKYNKIHSLRKTDYSEYMKKLKELNLLEQEFLNKEDEMLIRIIKLRQSMWH